ncbi:MAG TPA: M1 family metallopeptidase [Kofleriaceae bacterium]|nr:M1 family metallopeptidase [Kofleriaceae bacterium]
MPSNGFGARVVVGGLIIAAAGCAAAGCAAAGCATPAPAAPTAAAAPPIADPHSSARADRTVVTHLALDLAVDFATRRLTGTAAFTVARKVAGAELILDTDGLDIAAVTACGGARRLEFTLGARHPVLGVPLTIALPADVTCVAVQYRSSPDAKALLWVEPSGTAGGVQPMMFTQSEAILGRSWVPLQDTPSVRFTYDATVRVPPQLMALMSAENPQQRTADGVYHFHMGHPIPSYLMALAVGDFAFRAIGPRTGVYAEPSVVEAARHEFVEVDAMMATAEQLYGPYRWGRYDMIVLPPSFPFGGMENPMLTFLTPTLITGDRAMVSVIAHELAHSWAGNLVTNATWNDVWLNEGITTYVERRIMEQLRGREFADLLWHLGRQDLTAALAEAGPSSPLTRLHLTFDAGADPDSGSGNIAYEKGSLLLRTLEARIGRARFDAYLEDRFDRFAFQSTDSQAFVDDAVAHLGGAAGAGELHALLDSWIFAPGLPASAVPDHSELATRVADASRAFAATGAAFDPAAWKTLEWVSFVRSLPADVAIDRLRALDRQYHLTETPNPEIAMYWFPVLIAHDERAAVPAIDRFLGHVGRLRMVREVYAAQAKQGGFWLDHARTVFAEVAARYHPVTRETITALLAGKQH